MSSSIHASNKTKNILVLGKDFMQGIDHTTIFAEEMYSINFTKTNTKFCLSLHYNGSNSYLFVNGKEIHKFKTKDSEIVAAPLCLRKISKNFTIDNMKKKGFNGHIYDFSVEYKAITVENILHIHKYLMEKKTILYKTFGFFKKIVFYSKNTFSIKCKIFRMCFNEKLRVQSKRGNNQC